MNTVELIAAIRAAYPGASVNLGVYSDFCTVTTFGLPQDVFAERNDSGYPNSIDVGWHENEALVVVRRYTDTDIDEALRTALAAVTNPSAVLA